MYRYQIEKEVKPTTSANLSVIIKEIEDIKDIGNAASVIGLVYLINTPILKFAINDKGVMWFPA